jgi:hypothetical protein
VGNRGILEAYQPTTSKELNVSRLIEIYRKCPSPSNRAKLQAYLQKHMMAVCMATEQEIAFLKAHEFKI